MTDHTQTNIITLTRHVFETQRLHPEASGDLTLLLNAVQLGCKFVESCVRKSRLVNLIGLAGNQNVQGEDQKKLDVLSNEMFVNAIRASNKVAMMVSEEDEEAIFVEGSDGRYCITFDPLDGSSNIDAGVNVGTIFGIFKLKGSESDAVRAEDILMKGSEIKVAGYCMYGSSCNIVISLGVGVVNGFTLDPALGEFILTHPNIRIPKRGKIYSINEGNSLYWDDATRHYIESLKNGPGGRKPYSARYIGSMVADVHRTLLYGGIFAYPADKKSPKGKLRILYESFPMAKIMEDAGGKAITGTERILDLIPEHIHDRCPVFMGSAEDVDDVIQCFNTHDNLLVSAKRAKNT